MSRRKQNATQKRAAVRVAIYCRQSVATNLEFGSIDAQREAIEALIKSRKAEGWQAIPDRYDDEGLSGKNTDRPAFQRMLADVKAGKVDVVACYKLDRISRSVADLSQFVALLDSLNVAFVASSQAIDTSGSTGRLLLHVLGAVAQFEREAIGERTRDKLLAARRRGLWTGGKPILGYDIVNKELVVNEQEATGIAEAFEIYLQLNSLDGTAAELDCRGVRSKVSITKSGQRTGGKRLRKDALANLLRNPVYAGQVRAGDELVEGRHEAIVDRDLWTAVQRRLDENAVGDSGNRNKWDALLRGVAHCGACGGEMRHETTKRNGRVYRYYACVGSKPPCSNTKPTRTNAAELEQFVIEKLRAIGQDARIVDHAIAATKDEAKRLRPALRSRVRRLQSEVQRQRSQREGLLAAAAEAGAKGGPAIERAAELDEEMAPVLERLAEARAEIDRLDAVAIDAEALRDQLAAFDAVFEQLTIPERVRLIALVVESVTVDAMAKSVEIRFRGVAPAARRDSA